MFTKGMSRKMAYRPFFGLEGAKNTYLAKKGKNEYFRKKSPITIWALQMYTKYKKIRKIQWFTKTGVKCAHIPVFLH